MSDSNIFDHASKKVKKKKAKPAKKTFGDQELDEMFNKIYSLKDEVDAKIHRIGEIAGMSPKEMNSYFENPNNFTPQVWSKIERQKKEAEDKIYGELGLEAKAKRMKKLKEQQSKSRLGKTLGARKKWLQM